MTLSLSLILSGAGSLQVTVMEVVVRLATARPCGGPVGTGEEGRNVYRSYRDLLMHAVMAGALLLLHKGYIRCA